MKHQARKRFGQNFLTDQHIIDQIIDQINPQPTQHIVEIGPGLGALTLPLLARCQSLHVIEIDRDLIQKLTAQQLPGLHIHEADVLTVNWQQFANGNKLRVVGNLPYNVGTPLMLELLQAAEHVEDIHVMLQKEVVERMVATVGTRAFGRFSVMMQSSFNMQTLLHVPPSAFSPAPKVHSAIVRLQVLDSRPDSRTIERLSQATRVAFANKRKTLRNNLKDYITMERLQSAGIDPSARAETLSLQQFLQLAEMLP